MQESQKEAAAQLRRLSSTAGIAIQADKENVVKVTPVKSKDSEPKDVMRELATLAMLMGK